MTIKSRPSDRLVQVQVSKPSPARLIGPASGRACLAVALGLGLAVMAGAGTASAAAGDRFESKRDRYSDRHADRSGDGYLERGRHGWFMINGHRCRFDVRGNAKLSLWRALRREGHHAWIADGCVVIQGRRIRFSASVPGHRFIQTRRGHRTFVRIVECDSSRWFHGGGHWDRPRHGRPGRHWDRRDDCRPKYRRWHRPRRGCDAGFGVRFGDGGVTVRFAHR